MAMLTDQFPGSEIALGIQHKHCIPGAGKVNPGLCQRQ
jgi:hypothetical protein